MQEKTHRVVEENETIILLLNDITPNLGYEYLNKAKEGDYCEVNLLVLLEIGLKTSD